MHIKDVGISMFIHLQHMLVTWFNKGEITHMNLAKYIDFLCNSLIVTFLSLLTVTMIWGMATIVWILFSGL